MQEWSREEIQKLLDENRTGLLYVYTPLCGTCQVAGKMLTVVKELLPHQEIGKADLNYLPHLAEAFGIESVPCLLMIKDGKLIEKIYAFQSVPYLLNQLNRISTE